MNATIAVFVIDGLALLMSGLFLFFATRTGRRWFMLWKVKILSKNRPGTLYLVVEDDDFQSGKQVTNPLLFPSIELAKAWAMARQFERSYKRSVYRLLEVNEVSWPDDSRARLEAGTIEASRQSDT